MIVRYNTKKAEGLADLFNNLGKSGLNVSLKIAKRFLKNPGRASEIGASVGNAIASRSPKAAESSLPYVINSYYTGKGKKFGTFA